VGSRILISNSVSGSSNNNHNNRLSLLMQRLMLSCYTKFWVGRPPGLSVIPAFIYIISFLFTEMPWALRNNNSSNSLAVLLAVGWKLQLNECNRFCKKKYRK